ncbi:MAG: barstar family protein [Ruminococcaceae bacterium]|nr:barstar family protein [Oscillospiraceae bacterium]
MYSRFDPSDSNSFYRISEDPVVLDFAGCRYLGELHQVLKKGLGLPDYYGENWDALWDCLWHFRDYPLTIEVSGLHDLPDAFSEEIRLMKEVFADVHKESPNITFLYLS